MSTQVGNPCRYSTACSRSRQYHGLDKEKKSMGGPIVRTGTTPEFWENYDRVFGAKNAPAKAAAKKAAPKKSATKKAAKKKK
ncbi:MAG: hypothetical protein NT069_17785 [Planctomycetota bacterium]|nr:hypothetical protein [Planctomycetota bacterium]